MALRGATMRRVQSVSLKMATEKRKTLFTVQALRAIAAASVVFYHVLNMLVRNAGYSFKVPAFGAAGVDLFFLISGFVMIYTHFDEFSHAGASGSFVRRRLIRIAPLYWLATTVMVILLVGFPNLFSTAKMDWNNAAFSYLFLLSPNSEGVVGTVTQTGWTLCYEFYFYAMFAVLLLLPRRYFLTAAGLIFFAGLLINAWGTTLPPWLTVATNPLLVEFYVGSVIAFLFLAGVSLPPGIAIVAIIFSIVGILVIGEPSDGWQRVFSWGIPSAVILAGAVSLERIDIRVPKILIALGASSYSLYIIHPFVLPAFGKAWALMHLPGKVPAFVLGIAAFSAALIVAHGVHLWLERPMTEWLLRGFPVNQLQKTLTATD
jgi:peptidoglycan/LPS O-acetylase OafA/YrhL